jgi:hypothetical protein
MWRRRDAFEVGRPVSPWLPEARRRTLFADIIARMRKSYSLAIGAVIFAAGLAVGGAWAGEKLEARVKVALDNARVTVNAVDLAPGASRAGRTRPTDEVVLFCDEAHYQAIDAQGKKEPRNRTPGEVVFHKKGEVAPTLLNNGGKPIHYYSISLK